MSDLELLFLVVAVVYCWECAWWLKRGSVAFRSWFGRQWRLAHPGALLGNQQAGLVFANPLPPLGMMLASHQLPLSLSPEALLAFVAPSANPGGRPPQTGSLVRWEDIRSVEAKGKQVRINGQRVLSTDSPGYAAHLAALLQRLAKLPPADRGAAIESAFRESLDVKSAEKRWREFQQPAARVRLAANILFGYLFVAAPAAVWFIGLNWSWLGLLIGLIALTTTIAVLFRRAHKRFHPAADDERFSHFLQTLLWPSTAIRAHDLLSRPLLERFHPLALAKLFCAPGQFLEVAQEMLREIRYPALPVCPAADAQTIAVEQFSRAALLRAVEGFLKQNGLKPDELLQPPARADDTCCAYCPRCLTQFTVAGVCADCGGLPLVVFADARIRAEENRG